MPKTKVKVSIIIPTHNMKHRDFFLNRCLNSIREQTFQDFEIITTEKGRMAENTNSGMKEASGELIKILFMDDFFAHKNALKDIVENFKGKWMITGADTNPHPYWTDDIERGNNHLGSPSVLTIKNGLGMYFDERMSWLLDCDLYRRLFDKYGLPTILDSVNIKIGVGDHQVTNLMSDSAKLEEHRYMQQKYA